MKWKLFCVLFSICVFLLNRNKNNVCKTFSDYYSDRDNNPNCYYNPEHELEVPDIIKRNGYPVEVHNTTTKDGYILTVYRIPHGLRNKETIRKPILLNHGMTMNAGSFLLLGTRSFAFMLADTGYDVWLGNFRGTRYSTNHISLDSDSKEFWNFSQHELGVYDVPALLDLVFKVTSKKVIYIGYSLGANVGYIYGSIYAEAAKEKIEYFVAIGPGIYVDIIVLQPIALAWKYLLPIINLFTNGTVYPRPPFPKFLFKNLCFPFPFQMYVCQIVDMLLMGFYYEEKDPETLPVTLLYNVDRTSVKTITHCGQMLQSGNFQYFDYGEEQNKVLYGEVVAPIYNLSYFKLDNYIVYSETDKVTPTYLINRLYATLPKNGISKETYKIKHDQFTHIDFVSGKNAHTLVYTPIIEKLKIRNEK